ncbi:MAG: hypothetical protein ACTSRW_00410 [Candidatus Helarchaeota archaeon]
MAMECLFENQTSKILSKELNFTLPEAPEHEFELDQKILIEKGKNGKNSGKIIIHLNRYDLEGNLEHTDIYALELSA